MPGILVFLGIALAIPLAITVGVFILIPAAICMIAWAVIKYLNRPKPAATTAQIHEQTQIIVFPEVKDFGDHFLLRMRDAWQNNWPIYPIFSEFSFAADELYRQEEFLQMPLLTMFETPVAEGRYRDRLLAYTRKSEHPGRTLDLFRATIFESFDELHRKLPEVARIREWVEYKEPGISIPLRDFLPNVGNSITDMALPFFAVPVKELGLFADLRKQFNQNQEEASVGSRSLIMPEDYKGEDVVHTYLKNTPFENIFDAEVPFELGEQRFSGHWIIAPPGRGKTTLLHAMLAEDFKRDASVVIMDSKGDLIDPIRNLKELEDRYIIIDPDPHNPIAINPLDIPNADITHAVDLLEYLFGSLLEFKMTALQTTLFRAVLRALVTAFPNPTLDTFRDVLTNGIEKYDEYIKQLPQDLQDFFYKEFNDRIYADRRREVVQRLRLLLDNESMKAMLLAMHTRFDIGKAMDDGKVIIINNSKALLGETGSEFYGRFFIAQVLAAAQQRSGRRGPKKPVYFYIDECQNVIARDDKVPAILDECRSQRIALVMAHQRTAQISSANVLDALANCAVRYANSDDEARYLAPRLRTTESFLQSLGRGTFAAFVRDMTPRALAITVTPVTFGATLTAEEERKLSERMRNEYGIPASLPAPELDPEAEAAAQRVTDQLGAVAREIIEAEKPPEPPLTPDQVDAPEIIQPAAPTNSEGATDWR